MPNGSHYFDEAPSARSERRTVEVLLPDTSFVLQTDTGVFSHGRLDTGTALLLRTAPPLPSEGDVADLGCGAGAIALTMARRAPGSTVWAIDVNARALALCAENAELNQLGNVVVRHPDDVEADVRFAAIWSNPPIRIGKQALHRLLTRWLARLQPDGEAALVVQRHLGADSLHRWLAGEGYAVERIDSRAGYRVLGVQPTLRDVG